MSTEDPKITLMNLLKTQWDGVGVGFTPLFTTDWYDERVDDPQVTVLNEETTVKLPWMTNDSSTAKRIRIGRYTVLVTSIGDQVKRWAMIDEVKRILRAKTKTPGGRLKEVDLLDFVDDDEYRQSKKILQTKIGVEVRWGLESEPPPPWLPGYGYRKSLTLTGAAGAGLDYTIRIRAHYGSGVDGGEDVYLSGHAQEKFGDLRFTKDDGVTELKYAFERRGAYQIGFVKLGSNPLKDFGQGFWGTAFYSNYGGEDKIYLMIQKDPYPATDFQLWSFHPADANNPGVWTNHGNVITVKEAWETTHREPHSVFFETQAMADAREGVGPGLGTRKWRLYYCGCTAGGGTSYRIGIATAPENDPTTWTVEQALNPIYGPVGGYGIADPEAFIRDGKVWMCVGCYDAGGMCQKEYYTVSAGGITSWTNKYDINLLTSSPVWGDTFLHEDVVSHLSSRTAGVYAQCTKEGRTVYSYDGNPVLAAGAGGSWDERMNLCMIPKDKNGSPLLGGKCYLFYFANTPAGAIQYGGAIGQTFNGDAYFWVKVADDLSVDRTIYIYYGSPGAVTTADPENTFVQYDEFDDLLDWTIDKASGAETVTLIDDPVVRLVHRIHTYCHIERSQTETSVELRMKIHCVLSAVDVSWMCALVAYFNPYDYTRFGIKTDSNKLYITWDKDSTVGGVEYAVVTGETEYWVRIRVTPANVYFDYSLNGITWTNLTSTARPVTWDALTKSILGHGYEANAGSYPNPDLDNNYVTPGASTTTYVDQYVARKYVLPEPGYGAWGAEESP